MAARIGAGRSKYGSTSQLERVRFEDEQTETAPKQTEIWPSVGQLSRLVAAISNGNLASVKAADKPEDQFLKRFSTRNVNSKVEAPRPPETVEQSPAPRTNGRELQYVVSPDSRFLFCWLLVIAVVVCYSWWSLIAREAFDELQRRWVWVWAAVDLVVDVVFVADIAVQYRTSYLEQGMLVQSECKLCRRYMLSNFWLDTLALCPLDYFMLLFHYEYYHPLFRLPRLLKSYRLFSFYYKLETRTVYPNFIRVANLTQILLLSCHWFACFHYTLAERAHFATGWFGTEQRVGERAVANMSVSRKYLLSLYWSTLTLTTIGNSAVPHTNDEYLFTIISYLIGVFVFATIVGQVGNVITNRNESRQQFERLLDSSKQYMRNHNVPKSMQRRVQRWYDYSWSRGRIMGGSDMDSLAMLPDKMKTELALHVNLATLRKVSIFHECQPEFLHDLVLKMRAIIFTPGDIICRKGEVAREMYIIADGFLEVLDDSGETIRTMQSGDFFGEIGILNLDSGVNRRTADVRSVGYSELFSLSRDDVLAATKDYPEAKHILSTYGKSRLATHCSSASQHGTPSTSPRSERGATQLMPSANTLDVARAAQSLSRSASRKSAAGGARQATPSPITNLLGYRVADADARNDDDDDDDAPAAQRCFVDDAAETDALLERLRHCITNKLNTEALVDTERLFRVHFEWRQQLRSLDTQLQNERLESNRLRQLLKKLNSCPSIECDLQEVATD